MPIQDIQFQPGDTEEVRLKKLRLLTEEVQRLRRTVVIETEGDGIAVRQVGNRFIISLIP